MPLITILILSTVLMAFVIGIYRFSNMSRPLKLIIAQLGISFIVQVAAFYYSQHSDLNEWLYNLYIPIEIWLLGGAALLYLNNRRHKQILLSLLALTTVVWAFQIGLYGLEHFAVWALLTESIVLVYAYTTILIQLLKAQDKDSYIARNSTFWIAISIIIYYACNIPFFSFLQHLIEVNKNSAKLLFQINLALCLIRYPLTAYALYLSKKVQQ